MAPAAGARRGRGGRGVPESSPRRPSTAIVAAPRPHSRAIGQMQGKKSQDRPIVVYDATCGFCRFAAALMARLDNDQNLGFRPAAEMDLGSDISTEPGSIRLSVDGNLLGGAAALVEIARRIPCLSHLALAVDLSGLLPVLEMAYRGFAPRRGRAAQILSTDRVTRR